MALYYIKPNKGRNIFQNLKKSQVALVFLAEPGGVAPELLQRASLVVLYPPCAEQELQDDASDAHQETGCVAAFVVEGASPIVEQEASDDRLADVVGEAHLAVWRNLDKEVSSRCTIVE